MLRSTKLASGLVLALAVAPVVQGAVTINGILDVAEGYTRYATQTNNTSFDDNLDSSGLSSGGSELNSVYGKIEGSNLHLFFSGNLKNDFNHLVIFVADGRSGQNTINASGALGAMNTSKFSPGFNATYAIDINGGGAPFTEYVNTYDMTQATAPSNYVGSFTPNNGIANNLNTGIQISLDNTNVAGVAGGAPSAADTAAAEAVTTGFEIAVPLARFGSPSGGDLKILAAINGGGNGYLSNQFLPGLGTLTGSLGAVTQGKFDLSGSANHFFSIPVPTISNSAVWASTGGGSWGNASNWTGPVPQNPTDIATLGTAITGDATITLDANRTVGRLNFNNAFKYTVVAGTPAGTLTFNDTGNPLGVDPQISVQAGGHEIAAPVSMFNGLTVNSVNNSGLLISGQIGGIGDLVKSGDGTLAISGTNTFLGDIRIEGGTLRLDNAAALSTAGIIIGEPSVDNVEAQLTLGVAGLNITAPLTTRRDLANSSNLRRIYSSVASENIITSAINVNGGITLGAATGGTLTVNGIIQDGTDTGESIQRAVRVNGTGHVILTAANTATGGTYVDSGTLVLAGGASLAGQTLDVFTNGIAVINGSLSPTVKVYSQGKTYFPGAGVASVTLNTGTLGADGGGLIEIGASLNSANAVIVNAGSIEFYGDFTGKIDLKNNQLITTNDATTVRNQLQANNLITTSNGVLGYKDNGNATTTVQFAVAGDANLDGKVNTIDFNDLAGNFGTGQFWTQGDFNYNGTIDSTDFDILVANYGKSLPAGSPGLGSVVPEPASAALLAVGAVSLLGRRRRD